MFDFRVSSRPLAIVARKSGPASVGYRRYPSLSPSPLNDSPSPAQVAAVLDSKDISYVVLERSEPGSSWAGHYKRLHLHTHKDVSRLPFVPMPDHYPAFVRDDRTSCFPCSLPAQWAF